MSAYETDRLGVCVLLIHYRSRLNLLTAQGREIQEGVEVIMRQLAEQKDSELANLRRSE
jgi:hypothetical protein